MINGLTVEESPIEKLLKEQQTLQTPVGLFSSQKEAGGCDLPHQAKYYQQLVPLSKLEQGQQYSFSVNLDKCTGCKACVSACHSLNGLDENETWRDVGVIRGEENGVIYSQTVTTACHHCVDPACMNGCPVLAYEKDEVTGIVRHLDDQCIGCQYCILKCPYDVPKYSKKRGIVRKCDMCHSRLADGEAPACVQACPTEAIRIEIISTEEVIKRAEASERLLPVTVASNYTKPTTTYTTNRKIPSNVETGDFWKLEAEHAHLPLVIMLVLSQWAVGLHVFAFLASSPLLRQWSNGIAFVLLTGGIIASTSHLGRPLGAWRSFLGLRRSWLSREIVVFGLVLSFSASWTILPFVPFLQSEGILNEFLGWGTIVLGLAGVFCSVMIYHDTQRQAWKWNLTGGAFFSTMVILGTGTGIILNQYFQLSENLLTLLGIVAGLALVKVGIDASIFRHLSSPENTWQKRKAMLQAKPLKRLTFLRYFSSIVGLYALISCGTGVLSHPLSLCITLCFLAAGEIFERILYFKTVNAPKMPGFC